MNKASEKLLEPIPAWLDMPPGDPVNTSFSLSVLIPVYNERYLVEASLRRVLALKDGIIHRLEVIVVDDCSRDGSWEILQTIAGEDERVVLLRHERNMGKGPRCVPHWSGLRARSRSCTMPISNTIRQIFLRYCGHSRPKQLMPFSGPAIFLRIIAGR